MKLFINKASEDVIHPVQDKQSSRVIFLTSFPFFPFTVSASDLIQDWFGVI